MFMGLALWEWIMIAAGGILGYGIVKKMNSGKKP